MANVSLKHIQIDKSNSTLVIAVAAAAFVTIFCLIAIKSLADQRSYQSRVIEAREVANDKLKANINAANSLNDAYQQFVSNQENIIGGSSAGTGERDGDNGTIVLDALPSKYDFPALTTSVEKLIQSQNIAVNSITGIDDEVNQALNAENPAPQPIEMPFTASVSGSYEGLQQLVSVLERSIRPFSINKLEVKAEQGTGVTMDIEAKSYYQPEKSLNFKTEVVK